MGKVTQEPKEQSQQIILRHYIQENNEETSRSPLVACEGCPLKDSNIKYSNLNQNKRDLQYCAISTNVTETSYLLTRKSAFSTSNREDKCRITRMVISPRSLNIYHNNIPKKAVFKNLRKNINDTDFLENIIITDPETSAQFQNIRTNLLRHKKLIVYTDGSLQKTKSVDSEHNKVFYQYKMGFGAVCITDDPILRQFTWKGNIEGLASSTRAELWGILSVLWVASHKTSITIFTDSESSIKAIKGYIEGKKGKHWSNYSNPHVLQVIKEIINTKELNIVLEKVEAHKGDLLNEQADKLAKLGVNSGSNFEINPNFIREQQCHFTWNKQEIDAGIKEFVKKKDEIESTTTWFLQHRINNWLNKNIINETNWKWSIETWHETKITNNKTNSKENSLRAFSLKLLNEELPTMATLHTRKPNIYTTTECPFCKKYKETNSHIFMCADYGKILKSTFRSIIKRIYIKEKGNIGLHDLMSKITRGHFLKINYHRQILGTQPSDRFEFNDLVKGLIPKSIYRLIRKKVNSTETGKNMVMEIFCSWKRTLYSRWKNRCKDFLNWEIKNDIGESDKKSKENHEKGLNFIDNQIIPTRPSEAVRYLGVWVQENGKKTYQKKLIEEKIHQTVSIMIRKRLTDKQSRYIINHVLFPQVEYLLSDYVYPEKGLEKLNAKIRMVFKRSCGHTSKLPNKLVNRINKEDLCSWTTKVRLQKLQDYMWTTTPIWDNSTINKFKARNKNLTGEILRLLAKHDIEIQINGKLEFPVIVRGGVIDIESFMGSDIWYHKHRDSLRKYGVLYIEQLLNSDLTRVLELKRIHQYEIPRKNLTWYEELRVKIEENFDNIREKLGRNPINRLTLLGDNTKIKGKFVTTDHPSGPIMGKITREPKEQSQQIILRHYIQENKEETSRSPLVACEGCPLKDSNIKYSNLNQSERDLQYCAISTNVTETSYLPTRKSAFSTSNREDKRRITRMVISSRSLNTYHNNIPKKVEFKNLRKNINDTDFLENIIITDPETSAQFQNIRTNLLRHKKKNLTWYEELRVKIEENFDNIREKLGRNPINRLTLLGDNTKIKGKFVTTDHPSGPIMGKITREPKEQSQQIILRHYIQENKEETSRSPLVACEGCPLKDSNIKYSNLNQSERDLQYCAISTNVTETSYLPTRKSAFSTSNREDKRRITRMVISSRSLNTYHNNIPKKVEFKNLRKNINDTDFLENIIITDPETSAQFQNIRTNLLRHKKLIVYTDGSLQKMKSVDSENNKVFYQYKMGFGAVCITDDPTLRQFTWKNNIEGPASSTRAELWGILSVLWIASHKTSITIFTDSESSIKAIKGYIEGKKGKHWSNYSNPHVLQVIKEIINTKELNIVLEKVEAHKGDLLNEQADKLAKLGVNSGSNFEINPNFIREQQCHFTWNKQEIDAGIKEFVKKKDEIESTTTWFLQHRINNWLNKNIINETNWKWSIETWHETKITNNKTNSKENSLRAFSLKLLNEELPTMATLHTRKPNIYMTTECPFCKKYKETNSHIFMCADYGKILKSTFRSIIKRIYIKEKGNIGLHDLMSKITRGHFLKINYHRQILGTQPSDRFEFNDLVKGLIPKSIYHLIRKKVNSTETGKNMVMEIFCSWKRTLYNRWKNRCKDFLNWEIKNDIGESDKKSKGKKPYIDYTYLERKKHLYDIGIDIKNFIINSVYKNNVDILSNIFFCLDVGGVVASQ
ncbi:hypothetical protein Glove_366g12 [Diversispora epigaea]|uniref:ribonuclease H n=1 Tax=Diversispora epigaea TaxID=1348612 RepID=A0A397HBM0_9GLOM|nr:hypothetical protein Glove_366g12 [Diversispora epigaea]